MSKYIGVDTGYGEDYSAWVIMRTPNWLERLLRRLKLSKATWERKVTAMHYQAEGTPAKGEGENTSD